LETDDGFVGGRYSYFPLLINRNDVFLGDDAELKRLVTRSLAS
jgi:hypothetical protein